MLRRVTTSSAVKSVFQQQLNIATYATIQKIKVKNPVVEMDGDEMTRIIWQWIKDKVCFYSNSYVVVHFPLLGH